MLKGSYAVLGALIAMSTIAHAQSLDQSLLPDNWPRNPYTSKPKEWPDGPNKEFLKNLMRPDNGKHPYRDKHSMSCCDVGDTVQTTFKVEMGDGPYPEGRWIAIAPEKIVPDYAPDGRPYLFMLAGTISASCDPRAAFSAGLLFHPQRAGTTARSSARHTVMRRRAKPT